MMSLKMESRLRQQVELMTVHSRAEKTAEQRGIQQMALILQSPFPLPHNYTLDGVEESVTAAGRANLQQSV